MLHVWVSGFWILAQAWARRACRRSRDSDAAERHNGTAAHWHSDGVAAGLRMPSQPRIQAQRDQLQTQRGRARLKLETELDRARQSRTRWRLTLTRAGSAVWAVGV